MNLKAGCTLSALSSLQEFFASISVFFSILKPVVKEERDVGKILKHFPAVFFCDYITDVLFVWLAQLFLFLSESSPAL